MENSTEIVDNLADPIPQITWRFGHSFNFVSSCNVLSQLCDNSMIVLLLYLSHSSDETQTQTTDPFEELRFAVGA